jgi:hypothetical protein
VTGISAEVREGGIHLTVTGPIGATIEHWALEKSAGLFRRVFFTSLTVHVVEEPAS